ncbi:hypothetical protein ABPG75_005477 [Micractinium tetrahymenae]
MDKIKEVDWRGLYKSATQKVKKYTLNLTDLEIKVEEATSAETWGPHGSVMNEIADAAFDPENYRQIMGVLARRLQEKDENWRMCYKALLLLEHLIKHGPGKIVGDVQSSAGVLDRLQHFQYKDANLKDHGVNVRHRAKEILQLINSPERLREEREKAKANRAKYRGVSADQMRSGLGASSFGRSGSDRYTAGTIGSLTGASSGGYGGASSSAAGGGGLGGSLGLGAPSGYAASRRTDSYDETEHDSHYISKRPGGSSTGAEAVPASSAAGGAGPEDALAATRARIEKLKLAEAAPLAAEGAEGAAAKKKLTDVRVNPKIAASLGLKMPDPPPPRPAAATAPAATAAAAAPATEIDLLGGLDEPAPAPAAAAPVPATAAFDPFAAPAAPAAPAPQPQPQQQQPSWDAFGAPASALAAGPIPAPVPAAASPLDLLEGLGSGPAAASQPPAAPAADPFAALSAPAPAAAPAAAPADPFAAFSAPAAAAAPALAPMSAAPRPAAPAAPLPTVAAGVPASLPEDMFSDLTGIGGKTRQPMGQAPHGAPAAPAGGALGGLSGLTMPAASPPSPGGGFGDFGSAGGFVSAPPAGGSGGGGMGGLGAFAAPAAPPQAPPPQGHARSGSMGGAVDFGSFSYSAPQQPGASAADPFADLLK